MHRLFEEKELTAVYAEEKIRIKTDRLYSRTHTWVKKEEDILKVGVTDYVLKKLKERISLIEMNKNLTIGSEVVEGESLGTLYSMPYANLKDMRWECRTFKLTAPCSGKIVMIHPKVVENPTIINSDPYGEGWIVKLEPTKKEMEELISPKKYKKLIEIPDTSLFEVL